SRCRTCRRRWISSKRNAARACPVLLLAERRKSGRDARGPRTPRLRAPLQSRYPWIDDRYGQIPEMFYVSCRDRGPPRQRDAGDLSVANIVRLPLAPALGCKRGRRFGSGKVKRRNPSVQVLLKKQDKGLFEFQAVTTLGNREQAKTNFQDRDGRRPDRY